MTGIYITKGGHASKTTKAISLVAVKEPAATMLENTRRGTGHDACKKSSIFSEMFRASPLERIGLIRAGLSTDALIQTSEKMGVTKEKMFALLHFARATVNRRIKSKEALPTDYSERMIGLQKLIGQVEIMVAESGDPTGFNAAHWLADWLEQPVAALNHAKPADFMDTIEGQELVASLLAKMQSGAYA